MFIIWWLPRNIFVFNSNYGFETHNCELILPRNEERMCISREVQMCLLRRTMNTNIMRQSGKIEYPCQCETGAITRDFVINCMFEIVLSRIFLRMATTEYNRHFVRSSEYQYRHISTVIATPSLHFYHFCEGFFTGHLPNISHE